jgi:DNA repair protein RadD
VITLRPYQQDAITSVTDYWSKGGGNPLVEMATGTGKSMVIAELTHKLMEEYPMMRVLMLVHVRELVSQNFAALLKVWPDASAGIYSAGIGKRDAHHRITFASIQSVFRRADQLGQRDLILIDEAHLVPAKGEGMYRQLLDEIHARSPHARVCGFTATPYRMDTGRLDGGTARLFDETVYVYGIAQGIEDGFLSPLVSKAGLTEIDVSDVQRRGGEFVPAQLEQASDRITAQAAAEICELGKARRSWLVFCAGVKHAFNVRDVMRGLGISCETVTGDTPSGERDSIIRRFKAGEIRCLTNAQVLTTGFDAPNVDLVVMLRPTLSTGLYCQIVGRGTRLAPGKENCLVLDYAGNIRRHGPVDAVGAESKKFNPDSDTGKVSVDSVRAKECPGCQELVAINAFTCKTCGHEWPREEKAKHDAEAEKSVGILSSEKVGPQQIPVVDWRLDRYEKFGMPDSIKVTFIAGISEYREWIAFEHGMGRRQHAMQWWSTHGGQAPYPKSTEEALHRMDELTMPVTISVTPNKKYFDIVGRSFPARKELEAAE